MKALWYEIRQALRATARTPWFSITAILMLGAGLGLVMYMFGAIQAFVLRPLPFQEPDRIAFLNLTNSKSGDDEMGVLPHDFLEIRRAQTSFESLAGFYNGTVNVSGDHRPERYDGAFVSANLFEVLGVQPLLGRGFRAGDDAPGAQRVVVLGHAIWTNRFGGDASIIGRTIRTNGKDATVVGVMPPNFAFPYREDLWVPLDLDVSKIKHGEGNSVEAIGRLKPGIGYDQAQAEISPLVERLAKQNPATSPADGALVQPYALRAVGPETRSILTTMLFSVFLVLLIACANVANLLMARAAARARETSIRHALGASRLRLIMNVLAEALVVSLAAAAIGFLLGQWGGELTMAALRSSENPPPYWTTEMRIDGMSVLFAVGIALATALLSGLLPAWRLAREAPSQTMREGGHGSVGGGMGRLGKILVTGEIALCVVLLISSGLTIRSVIAMESVEIGADIDNTLTGRLGLFEASYPTEADSALFAEKLEQRMAALPGATSAGVTTSLPAQDAGGTFVQPEGMTAQRSEDLPEAYEVAVTPGFFATHRIEVLRGRAIAAQDRAEAAPVVVVSQALAQRLWPGKDAVGERLRLGRLGDEKEQWRTVVGVVPNVMHDLEDARAGIAALYLPFAQRPSRFISFAIRTSGDPQALARAARDAVAGLDPDLPIYWLRPLQEWVDAAAFDHRLLATLFGIFGLFAVALAAAGIYAVLAYGVNQRTREIGVRRALGARNSGIVRMVLNQGLLQIGIGLGVGLLLSVGFAQLLSNFLYGVTSFDPFTFLGVSALLLLVAVVASVVPTRRALGVQPMEALRYE